MGPHICNVCDKSFNYKHVLKRHLLIHQGTKPYVCNVCNKSFNQQEHLNSHSLIHKGIKPHTCTVCNKSFTRKGDLNKHFFMHAGIKPHVCTICDQRFTQKGDLNQHLMIHEGIKPHVCSYCGKSFTLKTNLTIHSLIHTGIKPYECNICGKSFSRKHNLKIHIQTHKNSQKMLETKQNPSGSVKNIEDSHEMNQDLDSYFKIFVKEESNLSTDSEDELTLPPEEEVKQTLNIPVDGQVKEEQDSSFDKDGRVLYGVKIEQYHHLPEENFKEIVKEEIDLSYGEEESWDS